MEELQVPTRRIPVQVYVTTGAPISGALFVYESPYHTGDLADVIRLLNDGRDFLPFAPEGETSRGAVLNKAQIVRVHLPHSVEARFERARGSAAAGGDCELHLADGSCVKGMLSIDTPITLSRLLDKLNLAATFVPVVTDDGIDFVRRSHVVHAS